MAVRKNPDRIHTFAISITSVKNCFEMHDLTVTLLPVLHLILEEFQASSEKPSCGRRWEGSNNSTYQVFVIG